MTPSSHRETATFPSPSRTTPRQRRTDHCAHPVPWPAPAPATCRPLFPALCPGWSDAAPPRWLRLERPNLQLDRKAPIMQGALLSSPFLIPFVPAEELEDTLKELFGRIWEFWDEYGRSRERVGELIHALACPLSKASDWNRLQKWCRRPETTHTSFSRTYKGVTNEHDCPTTKAHRYRPAALRQVSVSAGQEELWQVEISRERGSAFSPDGEIVVDTSRLYQWPKGQPSAFNDPGAFLPT